MIFTVYHVNGCVPFSFIQTDAKRAYKNMSKRLTEVEIEEATSKHSITSNTRLNTMPAI